MKCRYNLGVNELPTECIEISCKMCSARTKNDDDNDNAQKDHTSELTTLVLQGFAHRGTMGFSMTRNTFLI